MKKITILTVLSILMFNTSHAQISKGSTLLGGDFSLGIGKEKSDSFSVNQNSIYITPVFAKAIKENLFVGGFIGFGISNSNSVSFPVSRYKNEAYSGGILVRKYIALKNNFYIFGQGNLGLSYTKSSYGYINANNNSIYVSYVRNSVLSASVSPGISYALTNKFHLEAGFNNLLSLSYSNSINNDPSSSPYIYTKRNGVSINTSLNNMSSQLYMGFRLLIQNKKK